MEVTKQTPKEGSPDSGNRVVFIINSLEGGGAERVMANALRIMEDEFRQLNYSVYLILLDQLEESQEVPAYVQKVTLDSQGSLIKGYQQLQQILTQIHPLFCVSFLTRANFLTALLAKKVGYKSIISERVNTSSHFSSGLKDVISKTLIRWLYPKADRIIAVSDGVKADLISNFGIPESKVGVMYNPFNVAKLQNMATVQVPDIPNGNPYIIGTGRLVKNKNFELMLRAFAKSTIPHHLVILGKGELETQLKALATELGISEKVHFLGFKQNPYPYLLHADFFVSTSNAEGFPNAIVEAMCLGKPVVVTNCESGPAEILTGNNAYSVDSYEKCEFGMLCAVNHLDGVARALAEMAKPENINVFGLKSLARANTFTEETFKQTLLLHMNSVLE